MDKPVKNLMNAQDLHRGADNLLLNCLGAQKGESLLLVLEQDNGLYDKGVSILIEKRCRELGINISVLSEPLINHASEFPNSVSDVMRRVDHTLFLSRLGDYVRFVELPGDSTKTTSYTYTTEQLNSPYASISHTLLAQLRDKLEQELLDAENWQITCPLGTNLSGSFCWPSLKGGKDDELQVALFPVSTFKPVPCCTANGRVALSRWLMPGGAPKLELPGMDLAGCVYCDVENGTIKKFDSQTHEADKVAKHYDRVASTLGVNRNRVHSWHLGINPQTYFPQPAEQNFEQWCALSFASPRYLHFHTCGDEPPGEIAWSLFNCTVKIDNDPYWEEGEFTWLNRVDNRKLISEFTGAEILFDSSRPIGI